MVIKLSKGYETTIDDDCFAQIKQYKWHATEINGRVYARRSIYKNGKTYKQFLHRLILGVEDNFSVDHINGDTLDNRKCNLRKCTNAQNSRNTKLRCNNTSGYKGVYKRVYKSGKIKYGVTIEYNGKSINVGTYINIVDAANAYDKKAIELFGEFAKINKNLK